MAEKETETGSLIEAFKALTASIQEGGPARQVSTANAKYRTPWNPTGVKVRSTLKRTLYQNGMRTNEELMSSDEIDLANQLKPGTYQNGKWAVIEKSGGPDGKEINIVIPNASLSQRLELKGLAKDFSGICRLIIEEHDNPVPA